jgi:hypothetical protein
VLLQPDVPPPAPVPVVCGEFETFRVAEVSATPLSTSVACARTVWAPFGTLVVSQVVSQFRELAVPVASVTPSTLKAIARTAVLAPGVAVTDNLTVPLTDVPEVGETQVTIGSVST